MAAIWASNWEMGAPYLLQYAAIAAKYPAASESKRSICRCLESRRRSDGFSWDFGNLKVFDVGKVSLYRNGKTWDSCLGRIGN